MGLQGLDCVDSGFSNTFYQNVLHHPESMPYNFNYYLTGLVGGVWHAIFAPLGMQGFRLLEALTLSAAIAFMFLSFRRSLVSTRVAMTAIGLSFLFPSIVVTFHYNTLSFLFVAISIYCCSRSAQGQPTLFLWLSGVALGIGFFARIVNMALLGLLLVPLCHGYITKNLHGGLRQAGLLAGGIATGCLLVLGLMSVLGHLPYFLDTLAEDFGFLNGTQNSHGSGNLLTVYLKSYVNIGLQLLALLLFYALYLATQHLSSGWSNTVNAVLAVLTMALILTSQPYLSAVALCILLCMALFCCTDVAGQRLSLVLYALAATLLLPMGSDIGIPGIFHWTGGLLIFPAATFWPMANLRQRHAIGLCALLIGAVMAGRTAWKAYGEEGSRLACTQMVQPNRLNTLTEPQKARTLQHIIDRICQHSTDNPWLVFGNQASELYYATARKPFLGNTQLGTYTGQGLSEQLDRRLATTGQAPVVVFLHDKYHFSNDDAATQQILSNWMHAYGYQIACDDSCLTIYTPMPKTIKKKKS